MWASTVVLIKEMVRNGFIRKALNGVSERKIKKFLCH